MATLVASAATLAACAAHWSTGGGGDSSEDWVSVGEDVDDSRSSLEGEEEQESGLFQPPPGVGEDSLDVEVLHE